MCCQRQCLSFEHSSESLGSGRWVSMTALQRLLLSGETLAPLRLETATHGSCTPDSEGTSAASLVVVKSRPSGRHIKQRKRLHHAMTSFVAAAPLLQNSRMFLLIVPLLLVHFSRHATGIHSQSVSSAPKFRFSSNVPRRLEPLHDSDEDIPLGGVNANALLMQDPDADPGNPPGEGGDELLTHTDSGMDWRRQRMLRVVNSGLRTLKFIMLASAVCVYALAAILYACSTSEDPDWELTRFGSLIAEATIFVFVAAFAHWGEKQCANTRGRRR